MKAKRIVCGVILAMILAAGTVSVAASSPYSWQFRGKNLNAVFYGRVDFTEGELVCPDVITYYAHLSGSDRSLATMYNPAEVAVTDKKGKTVLSLKVYDRHEYNTQQIKKYISGSYVNVKCEFDDNSSSGRASD